MTVIWKEIAEHPLTEHEMRSAPRVLVWGERTGVQFGHVYHYADGYLRAQAEGYHGEWGITHYAEVPAPPTRP
jgi:hypothetical protein